MSITVLRRARLVIGVVAAFWVAAGYAQDEAADVEEASAVAAEEEAAAEDEAAVAEDKAAVAEDVAEAAVEESAPAAVESGPYASILTNLPLRNGVFKDPPVQAVNLKMKPYFEIEKIITWGPFWHWGKGYKLWKRFKSEYEKSEKALETGESKDIKFDLIKMAISYEFLDYIVDRAIQKKKITVARDSSVFARFKETVAENVGADIWESLYYTGTIEDRALGLKASQKLLKTYNPGVVKHNLKVVETLFYPNYLKGYYKAEAEKHKQKVEKYREKAEKKNK